jgi:polyhydroxyalkanoate synthesis regulator phasin
MFTIIKKSLLTGIGLALIAKDEVEELAREMAQKSNMSEKEGMKFIKDIQQRYDTTQKKLEEKVENVVKEFMKRADIVTGDELKALKKEIRDLKKAVSEQAES